MASTLAMGAQQPGIFDNVIALEGQRQAATEAGDHVKALAFSTQLMAELASLPDSIVDNMDQMWANQYYELACHQSRCGLVDEALLSLYNAACKGWNNYDHLLVDHDLDNLRDSPRFAGIALKVRNRDFKYILSNCPDYNDAIPENCPDRIFADPADPHLQQLRTRLNLDSVAGDGDEISRIQRITTFVHNYIHHNGMKGIPCDRNSLAMIDSCANGRNTLNCRGMAIFLNECLLSMGIPSMYVTCMPKVLLSDCHVINAVWSSQLGRWLWMDPSFNAWISDEQGNLLGIREVRQRLRQGLPLVLNPEASHYDDGPTEKSWYLDYYMTKNLYAIEANVHNVYGAENSDKLKNGTVQFIALIPPTGDIPDYARKLITTTNDAWFWQAPL